MKGWASHMASLHSELTFGELQQFMLALSKAGVTRESIRMVNNDPEAAKAMVYSTLGHQGYLQAVQKLRQGVSVDYRSNPFESVITAVPACFKLQVVEIRDTPLAQKVSRDGLSMVSLELVQLPNRAVGFLYLKEVAEFLGEKGLSPATVRDCAALSECSNIYLACSLVFREVFLVGSYGLASAEGIKTVYSLKVSMGFDGSMMLSREGSVSFSSYAEESDVTGVVDDLRIRYPYGEHVLAVRSIVKV